MNMFNKKPVQACVNCHFFRKESYTGFENARPWVTAVTEKERELCRSHDFTWLKDSSNIGCYFSVWDGAHQLTDRYEIIVETDRKDFCFFWKNTPGMFFPAAKVLQKREAQDKEIRRDRRLTIAGLFVAAVALAFDTYLQVAEILQIWPY